MTIQGLDERTYSELTEAKRAGHKFMKIYLNRAQIGRGQRQVIISGAVVLNGIRIGSDDFGQDTYRFDEMRGESMVFEFNPEEREFICWVYDDPGRGYFSPYGYNRDLLATHWDEPYFVIKDPEVYADVKSRAQFLKDNPQTHKISKEKATVGNINNAVTADEIDSQIEFLKQRKVHLLEVDDKLKKDDDIREEAYQKKIEQTEPVKAEKIKPSISVPKKPENSVPIKTVKKTETLLPVEKVEA